MILFASLSFLLLLAVAYPIARPYLVTQTGDRGVAELRGERDRIAAAMHDLDMELATGKLEEDDYRARREARQGELAIADHSLATLAGPVAGDVGGIDDVDAIANGADPLERLIAERRRALSRPSCPSCGAGADEGDRFCRTCGSHLSEVTT